MSSEGTISEICVVTKLNVVGNGVPETDREISGYTVDTAIVQWQNKGVTQNTTLDTAGYEESETYTIFKRRPGVDEVVEALPLYILVEDGALNKLLDYKETTIEELEWNYEQAPEDDNYSICKMDEIGLFITSEPNLLLKEHVEGLSADMVTAERLRMEEAKNKDLDAVE